MGFVTNYLQSKQMSQDLKKTLRSDYVGELEQANEKYVCALLRWRQWFENPYVDQKAVGIRPATQADFEQYCNEILVLLARKDVSEKTMRPQINHILTEKAKSMMQTGPDFEERFLLLVTMGACEYHGFNGYYTDSIKKHGLDFRFEEKNTLEPIYRILKRVGAPTSHSRFKHDPCNYVTNDPYVGYIHSKSSPKWFCYFNDSMVEPVVDHNYEVARQNLFKFPNSEKLTHQERLKIIDFFDQWWKKLVVPNNQKIAVMPMFRNEKDLQSRLNINRLFVEKFGFEKLISGSLYSTYEHPYKEPIKPEFIEIIDIPSYLIHLTNLTKLSKLQNKFITNDLKQTQNVEDTLQQPSAI